MRDIVVNLIHILQYGYTPLHVSAMHYNSEVAELLISHGADVNSGDDISTPPIPISGVSPSHNNNYYVIYLIFYEQSMISHLVIYIMNIDDLIFINLIHIFQFEYTPLHVSAENNNREVAELLIRHGANVNSKDYVSIPSIPISDISPSHYNNYYSILST